MKYLLDTVALVRHFAGTGKIGRAASDVLRNQKSDLAISVVSLMEVMYLSEKNRIDISLSETLDKIHDSDRYSVVDLNPEILKVAEKLDVRELHDRLILASAKWLGIGVLSSDSEFPEVKGVEIIWD